MNTEVKPLMLGKIRQSGIDPETVWYEVGENWEIWIGTFTGGWNVRYVVDGIMRNVPDGFGPTNYPHARESLAAINAYRGAK